MASGKFTRRGALQGLGAMAGAAAFGGPASAAPEDKDKTQASVRGFVEELRERVARTPLADTHEHLPDEEERLRGERIACDDWAVLFSHYVDSDLVSAGMPAASRDRLLSRGVDPKEKWAELAPWWPAVKNTGYGQAVRISIRELYGIEELDARSIRRLQEAYQALRKPGLYRKVLVERAGLDHCQVNYIWRPFRESRDPTLLLQDISIVGMHIGPAIDTFAGPAGISVKGLADWHRVIAWWFDTYGPYAAAVKSQAAYGRGLDYEEVPAERAEPVFKKVLRKEPVGPQEKKTLEDHLFWVAVREATKHQLPVKLHTGYYAGHNYMPLARVAANPDQAGELCRRSPETSFVFMHIGYPRWQDLLAVAKHWTNAHIDMCWAWILDPASAKEFLKAYVVAAPATKVLTFGGDYIPVELVLGHATLARRGIARALEELADEGWLSPKDALDLVEPLLRGNAAKLFRVAEKKEMLARAPWAGKGL